MELVRGCADDNITGNEGFIDLRDDINSRIGLSLVHFLGSRIFSFIYCDLGEEIFFERYPKHGHKKYSRCKQNTCW